METCNKCKETPRSNELIKKVTKRLSRITGQINGVSKMIEDNRYCYDVLVQLAAIESALKEVGYIVLEDHLLSCVSEDIKRDDYSSLKDALTIAKKLG